MKKIVALSAMIAIAAVAVAQNPSDHPSNPQEKAETMERGDYIVREQGKVWLVLKGNKTLVSTQVTVGGTTVKADGSVILANGTEVLPLNEGDKVDSEGNIIRVAGNRQPDTEKE